MIELLTKGSIKKEPAPVDNIAKKRGKAKIKISSKREAAMQRIMDSYSKNLDVKISVIQALIPFIDNVGS